MTHDPTPSREVWESVWATSTIERPIHRRFIAAVEDVMDVRGKRVLEVGCGSAVDSIELSRRGASAVAMDYSLRALWHASQYVSAGHVHVSLAAGDVFQLPFKSNTFDLVFSQGLIEHFTKPSAAIREQIRVIRPGGLLCIDVPQTWSLLTLYKRWHIWRRTWFAEWETSYSLGKLEHLLRDEGLQIISSYGWLYFPSILYGFRNLHTIDERHAIPIWLSSGMKQRVEAFWEWIEHQRWYYRWLGCVGVIAKKGTR